MPGAEHRPPAREPALRRPGRLPVPEPSGGERAWGGREGDKKGGGGAKRREAEGRAFCRPRRGREGAAPLTKVRGVLFRARPPPPPPGRGAQAVTLASCGAASRGRGRGQVHLLLPGQ